MAYEGELTIEGQTIKVVRYCIMLRRQEDQRGRPLTDPTWRIFLLLDASSDATITNWMLDPSKKMDGKLDLITQRDGTSIKKIEFKNSFCFKMRDFFHAGKSFSSTFIAISGKDITINSVELAQHWPGYQ